MSKRAYGMIASVRNARGGGRFLERVASTPPPDPTTAHNGKIREGWMQDASLPRHCGRASSRLGLGDGTSAVSNERG